MTRNEEFHGGIQEPMFLTAREIRDQYQALDDDRIMVDNEVSPTSTWPHDSQSAHGRNARIPTSVFDYDAPAIDHEESDDELFARKLHEATTNNYSNRVPLADHLMKYGVENPISLQFRELHGQFGKPQILGGHHRVAVMHHLKPDALMPVMHFSSHTEASTSLGHRY